MDRRLVRLAIVILIAAGAWFWQRYRAGSDPVAGPGPAPESPAIETAVGFRDAAHLHEHYLKHGAEFGRITEAEYLRMAQELRDRPAGGDILEAVRADGVVTRFDRGRGAFLAFERDGTIRTFFLPNDGERYFRRQLARGRSEP